MVPGLFPFKGERTYQIRSVCTQHKCVFYKLNFNYFNILFVILPIYVEHLPNNLTPKVHTSEKTYEPLEDGQELRPTESEQ